MMNMRNYVKAADDTPLFFRDWGEGAAVVFAASWALPSSMWQYQMAALTDAGLRCIAYDRRGHGRSGDPGGRYNFNTLSDDLARVIESLDLSDVTLVGHSMGACEITRYLSRHGADRIARVAFLAPAGPILKKTADNPDGIDSAIFEAVRGLWRRDFPQWLAENARPFVMPDTPQASIDWFMAMMRETSLQAAIELNRELTEADFRAEMRDIILPTLILHGTNDASAPLELTGKRCAQLIRHSKLKIYDGAPHGLFLTHAEQVNRDLLNFISLPAA
jgi:pimeloyl-ACP methyl ester carboxylesterase